MTPHDLRVRDLHAYYGTAHVLFGVELDVPAGRTMAVLGRNGAGKTTLLRSVANAMVRTTGQVRYGGAELSALTSFRIARLGVQLVPEDRRILTRLSVRDNLHLAARAAAQDRPALPLAQIIELFPLLGPLLDRPGFALSGGEQQLAAIARAMVANPTLLLLDEPSEGLAPRIVEQVADAVRRLRAEFGLSVVLAEQNTRFALGLADGVCLIDSGRNVWTGAASDFAHEQEIQRRYLAV